MNQAKALTPQQIALLQQKANALKALNNLKNPESLLKMASANNPLIQQAMSLRQQNGGSYDDVTFALLQQAGYDPQAVREQLVQAGII